MLTPDENMLEATVATLRIFENSFCVSNKQLPVSKIDNRTDNKIELTKSSNPACSLTGELSQSLSENSLPLDLQKNIPDLSVTGSSKFRNVVQALEVINLMYSFYHEKKPQQKGDDLKYVNELFAGILLPAVKMKLEKMQSVLDHITAISTHGAKLKQVLRSNVLNEFWKINVDYHKSVVRFFTLAQEITNDIQGFITSIEKSKQHNLDRSKNLHALETKLLAELHENLDILTEFRNYVQSSVI